MIRLSRLADYAVVVMTHIANRRGSVLNGPEIAGELRLPPPTVSKILKSLSAAGLLTSYRGVKGGYSLAEDPERVSLAAVISAVEGPIALTECIEESPGGCGIEAFCPTRRNWQVINGVVAEALSRVSLADMMDPFAPLPVADATMAPRPGIE